MESLEEKQKHLVIPSLSLVDTLIEGRIEHISCGNCLDFSWIYCTFGRILMHDNHSIVKWGLLKLLQVNIEPENHEQVISLIVKALNNTFIYEQYNDEDTPEIVIKLCSWFINFQSESIPLVEKFTSFFCTELWGAVPSFYILNSLERVSYELQDKVNWQEEQLDILRLFIKNNINFHPLMLRSMSQVAMITALSRFSKVQNIMVLSNLMSAFAESVIKDSNNVYLVPWFSQISYDNAVHFINQVCEILINSAENIRIPMVTVALIIKLLYKGKVICQTNHCAVTQSLSELFMFLDKIDVRPYVKVHLVLKIIDLIYNLFDLPYGIPEFICRLFGNYRTTLFKFFLKLFNNENLNYEEVQICMRAMRKTDYYIEHTKTTISLITTNNIKELETKCIQVVNNAKNHSELQVLLALQLWSNISSSYKYENKFLLDKINNLLSIGRKERGKALTGKLGSDYYIALSKIIKNHVMTLNEDELEETDIWLEILSSILDTAGNEVLVYFGDIVRLHATVVDADNEKLQDFKCLVSSFWKCNFGSKRERTFWMVAQKLTESINSSAFLNSKFLHDIPQQFTDRMLSEGESLQGLKYILLTYSEITEHFSNFMEMLLNGLLHGQVMRRDQRITMQAVMKGAKTFSPFIERDGKIEALEIYDFINRQFNIDAIIRCAAVVQLYMALYKSSENASLFLPHILEKLLTLQGKRYYADSHLHRLKHRLMQVLLILQPSLNKESTQILYHALRDSVMRDSDQHSVRLMKEWLLIRIYLSNEDLFPDLWLFFEQVCDERPNNANSLIGIIWHVAKQLNKANSTKFIKVALPKLAVCCMGQQFGMRLFGQVFFTKLYELLDEDKDIRLEHTTFYKATLESLRNGNFKQNPVKIDEDFFFSVFNPINHYTLETIYHQLPRLCNVSSEEWITVEDFEKRRDLCKITLNLRIRNHDDLLKHAVIPYSILKSNENSKPEEIECVEVAGDIQKKITPWKTMLPNEEEIAQIVGLSALKNKTDNKHNLIVVASFVEKSQNLGGIARTCEIFGVRELVVSNLKQTEDKVFQVLSVSADKWIKITEVKPFLLDKYLLELKDSGWTLIGAEQTANSINLMNLQFPMKTVLILGNEKNGIPANIIPLLDMCTEIPQFGVIRSLNVHVTSAICIWEYIKQHKFLP